MARGEAADALRWSDLTESRARLLATALTGGISLPVTGFDASARDATAAGGVDPELVDPATMESAVRPGLFFGGSMLNVDGVSRSLNLQACWSTGYAAGRGAAARLSPPPGPREEGTRKEGGEGWEEQAWEE